MRFDNSPPPADSHLYPIMRCAPRRPLKVVLLQKEISGVWTHYWNGKTIACAGLDYCDACKQGVKEIWAGYILAKTLDEDKTVMCAVTRPVKTSLDKYWGEKFGLFGLMIGLMRVGSRATSPIAVKVGARNVMHDEIDSKVTRRIILRLFADNANKKTVEDRDL